MVPVFKVQVFAINRQLQHDSEQFKGHKEVDSFVEDGLYKYTIGASTNCNDIIKLKKKLAADFPNCFIIAFDGDKRMNTSLAIAAFLQNAKKSKYMATTARQCDTDSLLKENQNTWKKSILATK